MLQLGIWAPDSRAASARRLEQAREGGSTASQQRGGPHPRRVSVYEHARLPHQKLPCKPFQVSSTYPPLAAANGMPTSHEGCAQSADCTTPYARSLTYFFLVAVASQH